MKHTAKQSRPFRLLLTALACSAMGATAAAQSQSPKKIYTPNMTWESIQRLPKLWGIGWVSPEEYDATQIVLTALKYPTFKPEYLAKSKAQVQRIMAGEAEFKQASCAPNGMTRSLWYTFAPVFLFQPGNRLILANAGEFREVFMDGRAHPKNLDSNAPTVKYNGHSIGWWEGEALVIDTVGVHPGHELFYGVSYSGPSHIVERYELLAADKLRVTVTVDAPKVLAEPWVFTKTLPSAILIAVIASISTAAIAAESNKPLSNAELRALQTMVLRERDARQVQNLMSRRSQLQVLGRQDLIFDLYSKKQPDISWGANNGYQVGEQTLRNYFRIGDNVYTDFSVGLGQTLAEKLAASAALQGAAPPANNTRLYEEWSPKRVPINVPLPVPYKTFSETFSYGPPTTGLRVDYDLTK